MHSWAQTMERSQTRAITTCFSEEVLCGGGGPYPVCLLRHIAGVQDAAQHVGHRHERHQLGLAAQHPRQGLRTNTTHFLLCAFILCALSATGAKHASEQGMPEGRAPVCRA